MKNIEINTTYVKVPNNDLQIDAYLAQPVEKGTFAAVIVFQEMVLMKIFERLPN
jgi:carboxymethylenebutenolidase